MYRPNEQHRQLPLMSTLDELPEKLRQRLDETWAGTFYRECFCWMKEAPFAFLYSKVSSRPNVPVNVLVGLETLEAASGWSDEETIEAFTYNLQVRYALGYRDLREGHFELRTLYNFRRRLSKHMQATGENLLEQAFEDMPWLNVMMEDLEVAVPMPMIANFYEVADVWYEAVDRMYDGVSVDEATDAAVEEINTLLTENA